ncbi:hypothetical protein BH24ACT3_BH24ACT3_12390 [soil metagenome]
MHDAKRSSSAQAVALARAHLTWTGVLDDHLAESMLRPKLALAARVLRRRPFRLLCRTPTFAFLGARTRFFDDAVREAIDVGVEQVVTIGAGYDSRAWRFQRPEVRYFEVDHPATQRDKRQRAPKGGPCYVPADLNVDSLAEVLSAGGFTAGVPALFVVEGVTMYLTEPVIMRLLSDLAELGGPGSRLAVNFTAIPGTAAPTSTVATRVIRAMWRFRGEPMHRWARLDELPALLARMGWRAHDVVPGPELARRYLVGTGLPTALGPTAVVLAATRRGAFGP